jgi:hypothetical protein
MRHLLIAAAATAILVQSASAQTTDQAEAAQAAMEQAVKAMGIKPSSAATDKADAAMTTFKHAIERRPASELSPAESSGTD